MRVPQSRSGRRSMSVDTMLRKEKDGSLFKDTKLATVQGPSQNDSVGSLEPQVGKPARRKKRWGDVPNLDDPEDYPKTEQTQTSQSTTALVPAISGGGYY